MRKDLPFCQSMLKKHYPLPTKKNLEQSFIGFFTKEGGVGPCYKGTHAFTLMALLQFFDGRFIAYSFSPQQHTSPWCNGLAWCSSPYF